ncbi:MAG: creatininase family protein [Bacteroidota bacterium]
MRPYVLAESHWPAVRDAGYEVAVLPWGATEAHNTHLPYATDNFQAEYVAIEAARRAWARGAKVVVLPAVPFGVNTGQLDVALDMNLMPSTQAAILGDVADTLVRHGVRKLVVLNGHGGNHFRQMIRELGASRPSLFMCVANWYEAVDWNEYFDEPGDHAGEMETSAMLHIRSDLVRPLSEAGSGAAKRFSIAALRDGRAWAERQWTQVTADTGVGDPSRATAEKGARYLDACCASLADFFVDLGRVDLNDLYS